MGVVGGEVWVWLEERCVFGGEVWVWLEERCVFGGEVWVWLEERCVVCCIVYMCPAVSFSEWWSSGDTLHCLSVDQ